MTVKILNEASFNNQIQKAISKKVERFADMITSKANEEMAVITAPFKGHSSSLIAGNDTNLILDRGQRLAFRYEIIPRTEVFNVFEDNALNPRGGQYLLRSQDPAWFDFNDIQGTRIRIRESNETSEFTDKAPLGSRERQFFEIVYGRMRTGLKVGVSSYLSR